MPLPPWGSLDSGEDGAGMGWVTDWSAQAACRTTDPDELFVQGAAQNRAKAVCTGCPVRTECLADALDNRVEFGVWGGMTERERRALLRQPAHRHVLAPTAGDRTQRIRAVHRHSARSHRAGGRGTARDVRGRRVGVGTAEPVRATRSGPRRSGWCSRCPGSGVRVAPALVSALPRRCRRRTGGS